MRDPHLLAGAGETPLCGLGVAAVAVSPVPMGTVNTKGSGEALTQVQGGDEEPLLGSGSVGECKDLSGITTVSCDGCAIHDME